MTDGDWAEHVPDGLLAMRAQVWRCGDEVCDCTQARIEGATQRGPGGSPWYEHALWMGTFRTGWPYEYGEAERAEGGPAALIPLRTAVEVDAPPPVREPAPALPAVEGPLDAGLEPLDVGPLGADGIGPREGVFWLREHTGLRG